jgi:hypothetical protein
MNRVVWCAVGLVPSAFVVVVAASCGSGSSKAGFTSDAGAGGDVTAGLDGRSSDAPGFGTDDGGDGGCAGVHCSSDLHSILDCSGKVVMTCPPEEGCSGSTCVPACQSAEANKSTFGCEYYAVDPDSIVGARGACFAMFITNTWTTPVKITADWGGQPVDVASSAYVPSGTGTSIGYTPLGSAGLQPGQVAILFLNDWAPGQVNIGFLNYACPKGVQAAFTSSDGAVHGTAIGSAFHVTTDHPVVAYDILPYGGGQSAVTSATLLIPTSAWQVNYIGVNAFARDVLAPEGQNFLQIVASQPDTTVTIKPTAAIAGGTGVAAGPAGTPAKYVLPAAGSYVQFTQDDELTGSAILADKPIGVWGGASCMNIDVNTAACDTAHQQLFPVQTLGSEYVAARYRDRFSSNVESTPWRIVGAVDGTTLTYSPSTPNGAPTTIDEGQVVTFWTAAPFVVSSQDGQHPFYISAHMTGANTVNGNVNANGRGDPEFVNVIPPAEFLNSYVFFTDPTYPETNLVVTRVQGPGGFVDVNLDCTGTLQGWTPIGTSGRYEYTRVDLSTGNFQAQGGCNNGRHVISSSQPFGLTVWGWGSEATTNYTQYVSYAYPAGASVQPINTVMVPPTQ